MDAMKPFGLQGKTSVNQSIQHGRRLVLLYSSSVAAAKFGHARTSRLLSPKTRFRIMASLTPPCAIRRATIGSLEAK